MRSENASWDAVSGSGNGKAGGTYESSYTSPKPVS